MGERQPLPLWRHRRRCRDVNDDLIERTATRRARRLVHRRRRRLADFQGIGRRILSDRRAHKLWPAPITLI